jgi:AcrR family transcriptional regulator
MQLMPKVSEEHLDARRRQIVDAAIVCFARDGFHRATMQDICREAGLSPGAIYSYFASKDELVEAIADERHAREAEFAAGARDIGEGAQALRALGRAFLSSLADPDERRRRRLGVQVWAEALLNPAIHALVMRGIELPLTVIPHIVREAQENGELDAGLDPDAVARVMLAMFQGFILQQAWEPDIDVAAYLETAEAFVDALLTEHVT